MAARARTALSAVVLIGRPNVGKSTLFNRLTGGRQAIVTPVPGTTRDALQGEVEWGASRFQLVDTGGLFGDTGDPIHALVEAQGRRALGAADLAVLLVDGREGLVPGDEELAGLVRGLGVPIVLAVNKIDDHRAGERAGEFHRLGFSPVVEVGAEHGLGIGDLLDEIVARLPARPAASDAPAPAEETRLAIIGRPNVGKSSIVNRLLREERAVVSDMPGTTRDVVDALLRWHGRTFRLLDTAGIRRAGRIARGGQVETVSVTVARRAMERADVSVIVLDAEAGVTDQDAAVAGEAEGAGCGVVLAANKWDLVKARGPAFAKTFDAEVRRRLKFLDYAPILHVSAQSGERLPRLLEVAARVAGARRHRVSTGELNRFVQTVTAAHPPASPGRREVRILYAVQTDVAPPVFVFFTNVATRFHFSYERFLVNRLREQYGFEGSPLRVRVRRRGAGAS